MTMDLSTFAVFFIAGGYTFINFMQPRKRTFAIFFCALAIWVVYRFIVLAVLRGTNFINTFVDSMDIEESRVTITTLPISFLFNRIKRDPLSYSFSRGEVKLLLSTGKSPLNKFDKERTGDLYILTAEGETFVIAVNLFDDFEQIRRELNG